MNPPDNGRPPRAPAWMLPAWMLPAWLLLATAVLYLPGLRSGLYVDDYYNLAGLAEVRSGGYLQFLFGGFAGPTGRPLSLLSFALQHRSWPMDVMDFKVVNLLLHLACGTLVYLVCRALARAREMSAGMTAWFCIASSGFWLLHPMHLSTVLYVVQRMTQLSALFVLLGTLAWIHGRQLCASGAGRGWYWMTGAVVLGTALAALAKENGILLAPLLLVLDCTALRHVPAPARYRYWRRVFLVLPVAAILAYLLWHTLPGTDWFAARGYTQYQKTLSEALALASYLFNLVAPRPSAFGLFNDDFPIAAGLLDPPATLGAVLLIAALLVSAVALRRRTPLFAAGVLWFFTGHLLESTILNLTIYFEHRNYLPSVGVALLFGATVVRLHEAANRAGYGRLVVLVPLGILAWITLQNALLWSQPLRMAEEAVRVHPDSRWALANLGNRYIGAGRVDDADRLYAGAATRFPQAVYPVLRQASLMACVRNQPVPDTLWDELERRARRGNGGGFLIWPELDLVLRVMQQGECQGVDPRRLQRLLEALIANPDLVAERGHALQLATNLCLLRLDLDCALGYAAQGVAVYRTADRQVQYADILLALRRGTEAGVAIAELRAMLAGMPLARLAYRDRLAALEARLAALQARQN